MPESERLLEKIFNRGHGLLSRMSERWDLHANRRTVITLLFLGALATFLYVAVIQPPDDFPLNELVAVPEGESLAEVAQTLEQNNVVRSGLALRVVVKLLGNERNVHAGDYLFKEPQDIFSVAHTLAIGAYGLEPTRVRVHEGAMTKEMAVLFDRQFERFNADNFLAQTKLQEGYLFPDTYFFLPNITEDTVIQAMRQNFDTQIAPLLPHIASSTHSLSDIVVMASIIEREAHNSVDRRRISGVLWNRLARNMLLQVDVTFLYTIRKGTYQITMKDLMTDSPYNTYKNKGLPPTAIGSPSLDSLKAAVDPINGDYLYYLADRSGVTYFSKTYAEHLRKKNLYIGNY
ncbi:endolytic transglycosylase MltG [Candidatus Kaiserbacteria bacterium]|nr:endolytic transglycosylase MltG [Candidatus Kaiserbacteria bacterium]